MKEINIYTDKKHEVPKDFTGKINYHYNNKLFKKTIGYYKVGELHREDGPAIIYDKGLVLSDKKYVRYFLEGVEWSKEMWFERLTDEQKLRALLNLENYDDE